MVCLFPRGGGLFPDLCICTLIYRSVIDQFYAVGLTKFNSLLPVCAGKSQDGNPIGSACASRVFQNKKNYFYCSTLMDLGHVVLICS